MTCAAPATGAGFLSATLAHLDCQAQTIGQAGYQALADPGSPISLALTALLSIFVAVIGIRFLMGRAMGLSDLITDALKVGFVLALSASWPAYRTVVYDVVLKGPAEIAGSIGRASSLPGSGGGLNARLEGVDGGIMALAAAGSGSLDISSQRPEDAAAVPIQDDTALGWGKTLFVGGIIGSFGMLRLSGGLLLALAPLFAGFLLFEATRFLFFGWLRSIIGIALSSLGIAIVLGVELAIIEPWLSQVLALRAAKIATLSAPFEFLALSLAFSVAIFGVIALTMRLSFAADIMPRMQTVIEQKMQNLQGAPASTQSALSGHWESANEQTRAQMLAQSVNQALRTEAVANGSNGITSAMRTSVMSAARSKQDTPLQVPLGRSYPAASRRVAAQTLKRKSAL